jgi:hypothetical protein
MSSLTETIILALALYLTNVSLWNMVVCIKDNQDPPYKEDIIELITCILWAVYITIF